MRDAHKIDEYPASFSEMNPNPIIEVDLSGKMVYANEAARTFLERPGNGKGLSVFLPQDIQGLLDECRTSDSAISFIREINMGDSFFRENIYFTPLLNTLRIYAIDITVHKHAKEALRESERHYRMLFENMIEGYSHCRMFYDESGRPFDFIYLKVNDSFERLTGLKDVEGKRVSEVIPGIRESAPDLFEIYGRVAMTGRPERFEYYLEILGIWFSISVYSTEMERFVAVFDNITERVKARQELERLNSELAYKNRELEQIIYVSSHDLRSPLVNIQGFSKELERSFKDVGAALSGIEVPPAAKRKLDSIMNDDMAESIRYILSSSDKMDKLLACLLKLSRTGRALMSIREVDMNTLIKNVLENFRYTIRETDTEVVLEELPPAGGDAVQLDQVFSNLVDNALKSLDARRGGVIRISGVSNGAGAVYCIEDNGIGISAEHHEKIFDIFHRFNRKGKGEGLGLTIARKILSRHAGRIWVESEPGMGAKFFVYLPDNDKKGEGE